MRSTFLAIISSTPLLAAAPTLWVRRRWSVVAGACLVAAVALWLVVGVEAAFVAATLGVVAWFWDQRNRFKATLIEEAGETEDDEDEIDAEEDEIDEVDAEKDDEARTGGGRNDFEIREAKDFERHQRS
jgi:hypothetical protein